jgi:hypothetical protein
MNRPKFRHYFPSTGVLTAGMDVMTFIICSDGKDAVWKDAVWMQWSHCVDDNKVEIYAGDILKIMDEEQRVSFTEVRWYQGSLIVEGDFGDYDLTTVAWALDFWDNDCCTVEVAGNIYKNPELLSK